MPKILIVDDEKNIRIILGRILKKQEIPYDEASNVKEAKELLKQNFYDVVFSDITMPGESGVKLAEYVLEDHKATAIVMVTTMNDPNVADEVLKLGVHGYITKPFDANQVLIQLSNALYRKTLEKQNRDYQQSLEKIVEDRTEKLNRTISDLKLTQKSLSESETMFRSITTYAKDGIVMIDENGLITYWNKAAELIFGFSSEEMLGRDLHSIIVPDQYNRAYTKGLTKFKHSGSGGAIGKTVELEGKNKNGGHFPIELSISSTKIENNWVAIGIIREISERKNLEKIEKRRATYSSLIYNVSRRLSHKLILADLLDEIVCSVRDSFNYYGVMIFIYDESTGKYVLKNIAGGFKDVFPRDLAFYPGEGMIGVTAERAETQIASDVSKNSHYIARAGENTKSELCVPIINNKKVIGLLDLQSIHLNAFDKLDKEAMEILCMQLAVEIENAQLFENMQNEILDRKQAEVALRQSEEKFQRIVNVVEDVLYIVDGQTREFSYLSPAFQKMFGYKEDDIQKMGGRQPFLSQVLINDDFEKQEDKFNSLANQQAEKKVHWESWWRCKDGSLVCIEDHSVPVYKDSRLVGIFGILHDITARKKLEERLRENETRIKLILDSVQAGIVIIDAQTKRVTDINPTALRLIGAAKNDVIGSPCKKYICSDRSYSCSIIETNEPLHNIECAIFNVNGDRIPIIKNVVQININNQLMLVESFIDISKLKETENALSQAQKLESIGQLAAGIAHEINTPMQYIGDNSKFLKDAFKDINLFIEKYKTLKEEANGNGKENWIISNLEQLSQEVDLDYLLEDIPHSIDETLEGVNRVTKIVRSMKEFSHPGTKEKSYIDINQALESTITVCRNEWKYVADLKTKFDSSLPLVNCLPAELNQVFLNIIINASHAIRDVIGESSGEMGTITVSTVNKDKFVEIQITDTGSGIPEKVRDKIFDPFFTTKEVGRGTGQGLSIAHDIIVKKHNGKLTFKSKVGVGTSFIIKLPVN